MTTYITNCFFKACLRTFICNYISDTNFTHCHYLHFIQSIATAIKIRNSIQLMTQFVYDETINFILLPTLCFRFLLH